MARIVDADDEIDVREQYDDTASRMPPLSTPVAAPPPPVAADSTQPATMDVAATFDRIVQEVQRAMQASITRVPPPYRMGLVNANPTSVADLKLAPPEVIHPLPDGRPTNVVLVMLPRQRFANSEAMRRKLTGDLMIARERGRVSGPIVCLSFVLMGEYIAQVQAEYLSHTDAGLVADQLRGARYEIGFGPATNLTVYPASSTIAVLDYGKLVVPPRVIGGKEITRLFSLYPGDLRVVPSFEEECTYVAFLRASSVYALLCSPFHSGGLQQALWGLGIFVACARCLPGTISRMARPETQLAAPPAYGTNARGDLVMKGPHGHFAFMSTNGAAGQPGTRPEAAGADSDDESVLSDGGEVEEKRLIAELFGHAADDAGDDIVAGTSSAAVQLPPELAALLAEAEPLLTAPPQQQQVFAAPGILAMPDPWAFAAGIPAPDGAYNSGFAGAGFTAGFAPSHPGGILERPPTPELASAAEEDLCASVAAAGNANAVAEALLQGAEVLPALGTIGRRRLIEAIVSPPSRLVHVLELANVTAILVQSGLVEEPLFLAATRRVIPALVNRLPLPPLLFTLASMRVPLVFEACLMDLPPGRTMAQFTNSPHFSKNLSTLVKFVPTEPEKGKEDDEAETAAAKGTKQHLTQILCGPPSTVLLSCVAGARFLEAAATLHKIECGALVNLIADRLASPAFQQPPARPGGDGTPATGASIAIHLGVAVTAIGADSTADVRLVKALVNLLHRPEARRFLSLTAPSRVHVDALPLIVANLEDAGSAASGDDAGLRNTLAVPFARRMQQADPTTAAAHAATREGAHFHEATNGLPDWLADFGRTYKSATAPPFPPVPTGWSVSASTSNGLYYYSERSAQSRTYAHPTTGGEYLPLPQAYVWERLLPASDVLDMIRRYGRDKRIERRAVDVWLQDQRLRHPGIDEAVIAALRIQYPLNPPKEAAGVAAPVVAVAVHPSIDEPKAKKHRREGDGDPGGDSTGVPPDVAEQLATYPPTGEPFPPLPPTHGSKASTSNGHFYFVVKGAKDSDKDATSYRHPGDAKHYAVSPQYFLERAKVPLPVFAKDFKLDLRAVEAWAANQTRREATIDAAALKAFAVRYKTRDREKKRSDEAAK
jgi:hypothetical protein